MRIPDQKIDEVRSASDIVDVISGYVRLKKRGKSFLGLCPFHQEKTPSFTVSQEKQMFHCFGCGKGGNVFTFVMDMEKVSFVESARTLAERAGIVLPSESSEDNAQATENELLYNACRMAGLHFHENLGTTEGKLALEYFHHRGFTDETIRKFGLGYSMNSWDDLMKHAASMNVGVDVLDRAGLVNKKDDGPSRYDRFRGRAMFPIFSPSGRAIGFGARKMLESDVVPGKYINSPETPIYDKSRSLYGLFQSKDAIRGKEYAILVEGYADLISVFQSGIENVVASSGTALTEEQIQLVGRYAKNITLVYDADSAGSKATMRGVDLVIEGGLDVRIAELPAGEDPDSFVKKHGGKEFIKLLESAGSFLEFKAKTFQDQGFLATPEGQARAVRSIVETIAKMKDELKRSFYIKRVAEKYGIYESVLFRELEKLIGQDRTKAHFEHQRQSASSQREESTPQMVTPPASLPATHTDLLKLMLEHGNEMTSFIFSHVSPDLFAGTQAQQLVELILSHAGNSSGWTADSLMNEIEDEGTKRLIADLAFTRYELSKGWIQLGEVPDEVDPWQIAEKILGILRKQEVDRLLEENQHRMKAASGRGESMQEFLEQHQALLREKKELEAAMLGKR